MEKQKTVTRISVTGATSIVGHFLLPLLRNSPTPIRAISRSSDPFITPKEQVSLQTWHRVDLSKEVVEFLEQETLIHLAPIWLLPDLLDRAPIKPMRVIAFSSTSMFTKKDSPSKRDQLLVKKLQHAEHNSIQRCEALGIPWTILRPTMIYGGRLDKNISRIASFIQRYGFFLLPRQSAGLRMPVHAGDLATATLRILNNPCTANKEYNLGGGESLPYYELVTRIFSTLDKKPRIISVPFSYIATMLHIANAFHLIADADTEILRRMSEDLVFDHTLAVVDFDYSPRPFRPNRDDLRID